MWEVLERMWPTAYFSHTGAMCLNGLVEAVPTTIFVNVEQERASPEDARLTQEGIDAAFRRSQRLPKQTASLDDRLIFLANGRNTWGIGLTTVDWKDVDSGRTIPVKTTTLERTLIDLTVRPAHVGGPAAVLQAFRAAAPRLNVALLAQMLQELRFVYPYGQAVGFYLERSGIYPASTLAPFNSIARDFDFYLAHGMSESRYISGWRLHVPLDL